MVTFSKRIMRAPQATGGITRDRVTRPGNPRISGVPADLRRGGALLAGGAAPVEERLDQTVEIAVEDGLHVPGLEPGALVLHQLVGLERVRADLAPEVDATLLSRELLQLGPALL